MSNIFLYIFILLVLVERFAQSQSMTCNLIDNCPVPSPCSSLSLGGHPNIGCCFCKDTNHGNDLSDCKDKSKRATCKKKDISGCLYRCTCAEGFYWDTYKELCLPINNGNHPCTHKEDCYDGSGLSTCGSDRKCGCINKIGVQFDHITEICTCKEGYFYHREQVSLNGLCQPCHPLCLSCYGPHKNQCHICNYAIEATFVGIKTCDCLPGSYYESLTRTCERCNILCRECVGPSNSDCKGCLNSFSVQYKENLCVSNCEQVSGYYQEGNICKSNS